MPVSLTPTEQQDPVQVAFDKAPKFPAYTLALRKGVIGGNFIITVNGDDAAIVRCSGPLLAQEARFSLSPMTVGAPTVTLRTLSNLLCYLSLAGDIDAAIAHAVAPDKAPLDGWVPGPWPLAEDGDGDGAEDGDDAQSTPTDSLGDHLLRAALARRDSTEVAEWVIWYWLDLPGQQAQRLHCTLTGTRATAQALWDCVAAQPDHQMASTRP